MSFSKRNTTKKIYTHKPRLNSTRKRKSNRRKSNRRKSNRRKSNRRKSNRRRYNNAKMLIGPGQLGGELFDKKVLGKYKQITLKYFKFDESKGAGSDAEPTIMYLSGTQEDDKTVMTPIKGEKAGYELKYPDAKDLFDGEFNVSLIKSGSTIKFEKNVEKKGEFHLKNKWRGTCKVEPVAAGRAAAAVASVASFAKKNLKKGRCCDQEECLKDAWLGTGFDDLYKGAPDWEEQAPPLTRARRSLYDSLLGNDKHQDNNNVYTKLLKKEIDLFNINIINSNDYRKVNEIYTRTPVDGVKEYLTILQDKCIFQVFINKPIDIPIKIGKVVGHVKAPVSYYEIELYDTWKRNTPYIFGEAMTTDDATPPMTHLGQ